MTYNVLRLDSSVFSENGESFKLNNYFIEQLSKVEPDLSVKHRALDASIFPHFNGELMTALAAGSENQTDTQKQKLALANELIAELKEADGILVGAPMYNFGIPSTLKAWMDHVARAGETFKYTSEGPVGLLENKKVFVISTRGGQYKDTPMDCQEPQIKTFFNFIGLSDIKFVFAEGLNMGKKEESIAQAKQEIDKLFSQ